MLKATFLAICLLGVSAAVILRAAGHQPPSELAAAIPSDLASLQLASEPDAVVVVNSSAKADKLSITTSANATKVVTIEPQAAANKKRLEPEQAETKSWHWSARSNKITRK